MLELIVDIGIWISTSVTKCFISEDSTRRSPESNLSKLCICAQ